MARARGTIRKTPHGYSFRVYWQETPGAAGRRSVREHGFRTRDEAQRALTRVLATVDRGEQVRATGTVDEFLSWWLDLYTRSGAVRASSARKAALHVKYLRPRLGALPLARLSTADVAACLADLREHGRLRNSARPLSAKTIRNVAQTLHKALADGVRHGLVTRNAAEHVALPRYERPELRVWSGEQVVEFLTYCETVRDYHAALWRLMLATGLRRGEVLGLRWTDVDLVEGVLEVRQALSGTGRHAVTDSPKTRAGRRVLTIGTSTVVALAGLRNAQEEAARRIGCEAFSHVATDLSGARIKPETLTRRFRAAAKAAGLPVTRLHDLRHASATLALAEGVPVHVVAGRLGHTTPVTTLSIYAHYLPRADRLAADVIERALAGDAGKWCESGASLPKSVTIGGTRDAIEAHETA
jgi:integrase